jgi:hypothetical protein
MSATAQIVIEVDDTGAVTAFRQLNVEAGKLPPNLQPVPDQLKRITSGTKDAREAAALLGEEFGIRVPRALRNIIAESSAAQAVLKAAFTGAVVGGFIEVIKQAVDSLTHYSEQLKAIDAISQGIMDTADKANKILIGPQNIKQVSKDLLGAQSQLDEMNKKFGLTGDAGFDAWTRGMMKWTGAGQLALEEYDKLSGKVNELTLEQAKLIDEQRRTEPIEVLKLQNAARLEGVEGIKKINAEEQGETAVVREEMAKRIVTYNVGTAEINDIHAKATAERIKMQRDEENQGAQATLQALTASTKGVDQIGFEAAAKLQQISAEEDRTGLDLSARRIAITKETEAKVTLLRQQTAAETIKLEEDAAVATVPPWQRSYAQISMDTQDKLRQIQRNLNDTTITSDQAAEQSAAVWQINFAKTRDQLATDMESFFDDITSGNIGQRFKKMFEDIVFQMVATWILGMNGMRGASSIAMGAGPTSILSTLFGLGGSGGGIFGGGGGSASGGTPPFLGGLLGPLFGGGGTAGASNSSLISEAGGLAALPLLSGGASSDFATSLPLLGLGLSAGQGAGLPGLTLPSGALSGGAAGALGGVGGLAGLLTSPGFTNLALLGGGGLLIKSLTMGGGLKGGLTGAAGGALIGTIIPGIGTLLGAGIGALIGLIGGLFGQHKGDKARIDVMEPLMAQIKVIKDSYDVFQTDYNTGVTELEALRSQSIASLKQIGGRQVSGNTTSTNKLVDDAENYLKSTEAERARRAQIDFGPAQFHSGGFVDPSLAGVPANWNGVRLHGGGEVPAILLAGEHVMNQATVRRIGRGNLDRMNAGGSGGGDIHVHGPLVHADKIDDKWLNNGGAEKIVWALHRLKRQGGY